MKRFVLLLIVAVLASCGAGRAAQADRPMSLAAVQTTSTTEPTTTTTEATTTTAAPTRDPDMPYGAFHGDQPEIVDEFAVIAQVDDCDTLTARRDQYVADERQMMATRAETGHRAKAEHDDRWSDAVHHRLLELGCVGLASTE